ncbi:hypothetical protein BU14_0319s0009 [Porphyra umbilicalis]|uniref:Uncharacterized protein n=1 Tax=Porphyra umbilicalis TaxID=2786 RepID=A0A1X6NZ79_PORUM|nr:hypothetical protein BU14_0319s0009 [Porphyra umbilicalis]|eukprot:OSX73921.1 hypothetical protein BU14_0319s0009 [Porphyra umbilicalis]
MSAARACGAWGESPRRAYGWGGAVEVGTGTGGWGVRSPCGVPQRVCPHARARLGRHDPVSRGGACNGWLRASPLEFTSRTMDIGGCGRHHCRVHVPHCVSASYTAAL